jgi:hypothetical protein
MARFLDGRTPCVEGDEAVCGTSAETERRRSWSPELSTGARTSQGQLSADLKPFAGSQAPLIALVILTAATISLWISANLRIAINCPGVSAQAGSGFLCECPRKSVLGR